MGVGGGGGGEDRRRAADVEGVGVPVDQPESCRLDEGRRQLDVVLPRRGDPPRQREEEERGETVPRLAVEGVHEDLQRFLLGVERAREEVVEAVARLVDPLPLVLGGVGRLPQVAREGLQGPALPRVRLSRRPLGGRELFGVGRGAPRLPLGEVHELPHPLVDGQPPLEGGPLVVELREDPGIEAQGRGVFAVADEPPLDRGPVTLHHERHGVELAPRLREPGGLFCGPHVLFRREVVGDDERGVQRAEVEARHGAPGAVAGEGPLLFPAEEGEDPPQRRGGAHRAPAPAGRAAAEEEGPHLLHRGHARRRGVRHQPFLGVKDPGPGVLAVLLVPARGDVAGEQPTAVGERPHHVLHLVAARVEDRVGERHVSERGHLPAVSDHAPLDEERLAALGVIHAVVGRPPHLDGVPFLVDAPQARVGHVRLEREVAGAQVEVQGRALAHLRPREELHEHHPHVHRHPPRDVEEGHADRVVSPADLDPLVPGDVPPLHPIFGGAPGRDRRGRRRVEGEQPRLLGLREDEGPVVVPVVEAHDDVGGEVAEQHGESAEETRLPRAEDGRPPRVGGGFSPPDQADLVEGGLLVFPVEGGADHEHRVLGVHRHGEVAFLPRGVGFDVPAEDQGAVPQERGVPLQGLSLSLPFFPRRHRVNQRDEVADVHPEVVLAERRARPPLRPPFRPRGVGPSALVRVLPQLRPVRQDEAVDAGRHPVVGGEVVGGRLVVALAEEVDRFLPPGGVAIDEALPARLLRMVAADGVGLNFPDEVGEQVVAFRQRLPQLCLEGVRPVADPHVEVDLDPVQDDVGLRTVGQRAKEVELVGVLAPRDVRHLVDIHGHEADGAPGRELPFQLLRGRRPPLPDQVRAGEEAWDPRRDSVVVEGGGRRGVLGLGAGGVVPMVAGGVLLAHLLVDVDEGRVCCGSRHLAARRGILFSVGVQILVKDPLGEPRVASPAPY